MENRFLDLAQIVFLAGQKTQNVSDGPGDPLIHSTHAFKKGEFSGGQNLEKFAGTGDTMKYRFSTSPKSNFDTY
jgi:hypothetical protein